MTTREGSDFWRTTGYGFVRDDGHALLTPLAVGSAVEVRFVAEMASEFDQAGLLVRADDRHWVKAGVELSDGALQVGAVVTADRSDWSVAPVPEWDGASVTLRVSWLPGALVVRARRGDDPWRLVRLAPWEADGTVTAGPYCCSPTHGGLQVRFTGFATGPADSAIHG